MKHAKFRGCGCRFAKVDGVDRLVKRAIHNRKPTLGKQKWEHARNLSRSHCLPHPPIPEDTRLTALTHIMAVSAVSTSVPLLEHAATSVAMAATRMANIAHVKRPSKNQASTGAYTGIKR